MVKHQVDHDVNAIYEDKMVTMIIIFDDEKT
uniref:Uncharacterized protein n=1 Tax=Tetranychus urticae TaxID=32264 RepID=T1KGY6_TETUR